MFPSVTICNLNKIEESFLRNINVSVTENLNEAKVFVHEYIDGYSGNRSEDHAKAVAEFETFHLLKGSFLQQSSQSCQNLFMSFHYQGKSYTWQDNKNYTDQNLMYPTDFGLCCVFVPHLFFEPLPTQNYKELLFGLEAMAKNGAKNGLNIVLNAEEFNYAGLFSNSEGFKIALHNHLDKPIIQFSSDLLHPGTETQVKHI